MKIIFRDCADVLNVLFECISTSALFLFDKQQNKGEVALNVYSLICLAEQQTAQLSHWLWLRVIQLNTLNRQDDCWWGLATAEAVIQKKKNLVMTLSSSLFTVLAMCHCIELYGKVFFSFFFFSYGTIFYGIVCIAMKYMSYLKYVVQ